MGLSAGYVPAGRLRTVDGTVRGAAIFSTSDADGRWDCPGVVSGRETYSSNGSGEARKGMRLEHGHPGKYQSERRALSIFVSKRTGEPRKSLSAGLGARANTWNYSRAMFPPVVYLG